MTHEENNTCKLNQNDFEIYQGKVIENNNVKIPSIDELKEGDKMYNKGKADKCRS